MLHFTVKLVTAFVHGTFNLENFNFDFSFEFVPCRACILPELRDFFKLLA